MRSRFTLSLFTTGLCLASLAQAQLTIASNLTGTFVDISATGTPLSLTDDGSAVIATTIGNALLPAGVAVVGSNGAVRFQGFSTYLGYINETLPSTAAFNGEQTLMPFWDDVNTQSGLAGEIYWQETNGMLIVQWENVEFYASAGLGTARFQLQVPSTGTTWARFLYTDIMQVRPDGGGSATIGYQAGGYGNDVEFSVDTPGAVMDGSVLSLVGNYTPPPPLPALSIVDTLPGTWIDISGSGTPLSLFDDDEVDIVTTVGNSVFAAGIARVGSNGGVRFAGTGTELGYTNDAIPSPAAFGPSDQVLLPFWDDINTGGGVAGEIYWQETGGKLIIQWQDVEFFSSGGLGTARFQVQVNASGNPPAQFLYQDIEQARPDQGASATIGVQGGTVTESFQWSFDTFGAVANGDVLTVTTGPIGVGSNYCTANANSTGQPGRISGAGSGSVSANGLTLNAADLPVNSFGFFLTSATQAITPNPGGSQGILCLGGQIGRYVGPGQIKNAGAQGTFSLLINLTQIPTPSGFISAMAGQTRSFQTWYRDAVNGVATSNFTNGLAVTFSQ
ncbi:MAG: hypothetical protein R3F49_11170 [Planctomycetota bacterium]